MKKILQPAVAGRFYPDNPQELKDQIDALMAAAETEDGIAPKALIAPHAGYIYSGPIAASAFAQVGTVAERIERVVLLGPSHRVAFHGIAATGEEGMATPLGVVPVDQAAVADLVSLPQVRILERPFQGEHCLEVELPFLQTVLGDFRLVPLLVGEADTESVAEVLELLWGGDETLIVVSSDLSHYLDYVTARRIDGKTTRAIEDLRPEDIGSEQACGRNPIRGLLRASNHHGLTARTLDLRSSGDTAGPRNQVVGYGAYVFG